MCRPNFIIFLALVAALVSCTDQDNPVTPSEPLFSITVLDVAGNPDGPLRVGIINHQIGAGLSPDDFHWPKPCPETNISFTLPEAGDWELTIYNYNGAAVKGFSGFSEAGQFEIFWDGTDEDGIGVVSGFYRYVVIAGDYEDETWMVLEKGPDPHQTIIGSLNRSGNFSTDNIALLPGLIAPQPIEVYTDTVTIHLSHPEFPDDFFYFTTQLKSSGNNFSFVLDSLGLPEALVRVRVVDTAGLPVSGLNLGSINHSYITPLSKMGIDPQAEVPISFDLPTAVDVLLEIYDYYGNHIRTLLDQRMSAGSHTVTWDGRDDEVNELVSGYYRYHLIAGAFEEGHWMILERGPDPEQTIIGQTNDQGVFVTADTLFFPCLLGAPPEITATDEFGNPIGYFHYADTVTLTLSDPDLPGQFLYFEEPLEPAFNNLELIWDPDQLR